MQKKTKGLAEETSARLTEFATVDTGYPLHKKQSLSEPRYTYTIYQSPACTKEAAVLGYSAPVPEHCLTREGDIIVSTVRYKEIQLVDKAGEGLLVPERYLIIRCNPDKAFPGFIRNEMLSDEGCEKRKAICRDAVLPHQKRDRYANLRFKLPTLEMQEKFYTLQKQLESSIQDLVEAWSERQEQREEAMRRQCREFMQIVFNK